jgi:Tfp pilus assembly protein PilV
MMRRQAGQRGVSLIEAIVALGVMAFGMLALVGVQATLRGSSDLARQRTEAMRIAQETMESYRAYNALAGTAGELDFSEITTLTRAAFVPTGTALEDRLNTTFYTTITAPTVANSAAMKPVAVTVDWTDRSNQFQAVELRSLIAGVPPELSGSLALPPSRDPFAAPRGRHRNVPLAAFSLPGTELSVFKPPQGPGGTVAWVFNNLTGLVTGVCTVSASSTSETITATDVASCSSNTTGQLVSGYVRFAGAGALLAEAENPTGSVKNLDVVFGLYPTGTYSSPPECFDDATDDAGVLRAGSEVTYYCLIYSNTARSLEGRTRVIPRDYLSTPAWTIGTGSTDFKICRYTPLDSETGTRNIDHPLDYTAAGSRPGASLSNQNFLVIAGVDACPVEYPLTDFFSSNTLVHQDGAAYPNP